MPGEQLPLQDSHCFEDFYTRTHVRVFRYIYGLYCGPTEEIEDLTAETFLRAWKARQRFSGDEAAATGWLFQIARNLVIDALRRQRVRQGELQLDEDSADPPATDCDPEGETSLREQVNTMRILLASLPIEQREMITLRYLLGWQVKQIAGHMGLLENTVSVNLRRALQHLRDRWPL